MSLSRAAPGARGAELESVEKEVAIAVGTATDKAGAPLAGRRKGPGVSGRDGPDGDFPLPRRDLNFAYGLWRLGPHRSLPAPRLAHSRLSGCVATRRPLVTPPTAQDESSLQSSHKKDVASMGQFDEARMRFAHTGQFDNLAGRAHSSPHAASTLAIARMTSAGQPRFRRVDRTVKLLGFARHPFRRAFGGRSR